VNVAASANVGFFSSYNARHLGAEEVARAFVPSAKFLQLVALQNALLVGARGSGKTHLLKMLQPKALNAWDHADAHEFRRKIGYWGIFVPADEAWRQQIDSIASELSDSLQARYRLAVFTAHTQRAVVDCFLQLTHDRPSTDFEFALVHMSAEKERELCESLAASWGIQPRVHSLLGMRQATVERSADLYEAAESEQEAAKLLESCQTQAVQAVLRATSAFDAVAGRYHGRWCLMFDEIEIAPAKIQEVLFRSLRSSDQKLIFKLALSPSTQAAEVFREAVGPSAGNDYDEISLYSEPKEAAAFCESLWNKAAEGSPAWNLSPVSVLGHSIFYAPDAIGPYAKNGRWQAASSSLATKDATYVRFLEKYGIDPEALGAASPKQRDAVVRKIGPLVGFRDFVLRWNAASGRSMVRNDKTRPSQLFSGWEVLCLVSEGNPRWFTGIAKSLLIHRDASVSGKGLSRETQYAALQAASRKFMDYVATIPSRNRSNDDGPETGLKSLLDFLLDRFRDEVTYRPFLLDPVLSFQVDEDVGEDVRQAIFDGLYSGAFVPVGDVERQFAFSLPLVGQRLRPTYLIAPLEILPLRTGKSRKLSTLLRGMSSRFQIARRRVRVEELGNSRQEKLFNE
jgi:hypothetical protein